MITKTWWTPARRAKVERQTLNKPRNPRAEMLWHRYKIREHEYDAMLEEQMYSCKICGIHKDDPTRRDADRPLAVDHDHNTGKVRGLLCANCNLALGAFKDNIDTLNTAIRYLNESSDNN